MADSITKLTAYKMILEHCVMPESKDMLKKKKITHTDGVCQRNPEDN